ncbi:acetylxylan esterase [Paenibacillus sp. HB172176]|uniref:acetylxylan esterase n=1 Tax=Paenibacillus sp. HB172176 TaxID=2493690 RepID=UPI00143CBF5B|nr:acetylxylan esterase [Paenibacillus sp. HB172176]
MNTIEKRILELHHFQPSATIPENVDEYWDSELETFRKKPLQATRERIESPLRDVDVYHISFQGFDETPVHGWYLLPRNHGNEPLPCVVTFPGYWNGTRHPEASSIWTSMGYATLAVHVRGQMGSTGNQLASDGGYAKGFVSQNIIDRDRSYYKAVAIDCVKALDWIAEQPELASDRIALAGGSQGGGLALQIAALAKPGTIKAVVADIPNMCHMDYGVLHSTGSLSEIADYCKKFPEQLGSVLHTLSYFDNLHLAKRIDAPVLMSVGLKDTICPPETIFPVYHRITTEKDFDIFPFCGHEVPVSQQRKALFYIKERL